MVIDAGRVAWNPGSTRLIAATVSTVLAPGWRRIASPIERLSTFQAATRVFSTLSTGRATSSSRTGAPFFQATIRGR